jgi:hypothetical protein
MFKRLTTAVTMTIVIAGASLLTVAMAAQGRGQGGPPAGVGGGLGAHSQGLPGSQGSASNGHGATHPATAAPLGPMSPTTLLQQNSKLESKLASFFPPGTDLLAESSGFKNLGQFVSAVHVSHNLGIPFDSLKCSELGTKAASASGTVCPSSVTNQGPMPLGKSLQTLKPGANSQRSIQEANRQSAQDINDAKPDAKS